MESVNKQLIVERSDSIMRCLNRIKTKRSTNKDAFLYDLDAQDIISLNLERAVQGCVDIASHLIAHTELPASSTMADSFLLLHRAGVISKPIAERMMKAVGLRNILVHEYQKIDWSIVWLVTENHLGDFANFINEIQKWLPKK